MTAPEGYTYWVSDEQIATYRALPIDRRIRWVEETARLTYALASPETRERWRALRGGRSMPTGHDGGSSPTGADPAAR